MHVCGYRYRYAEAHPPLLSWKRYRTHPSTGIVAAALLALSCDEVRVFGFRDFDGPYHYWDDFDAWRAAPAPPPLSPLACPFADGDSVLGYAHRT